MSGGSVSYYKVHIDKPTTFTPYDAECNDIIEKLKMNFAEGEAFKELWRMCSQKALNNGKEGNTPKRSAEKILTYALRIAVQNGADVDKIISGMNTK